MHAAHWDSLFIAQSHKKAGLVALWLLKNERTVINNKLIISYS